MAPLWRFRRVVIEPISVSASSSRTCITAVRAEDGSDGHRLQANGLIESVFEHNGSAVPPAENIHSLMAANRCTLCQTSATTAAAFTISRSQVATVTVATARIAARIVQLYSPGGAMCTRMCHFLDYSSVRDPSGRARSLERR